MLLGTKYRYLPGLRFKGGPSQGYGNNPIFYLNFIKANT